MMAVVLSLAALHGSTPPATAASSAEIAVELPLEFWGARAATLPDGRILIIGGQTGFAVNRALVLFDPATLEAKVLDEQAPTSVVGGFAGTFGDRVHVLAPVHNAPAAVFTYNATSGEVEFPRVRAPRSLAWTAGVAVGRAAYFLGGGGEGPRDDTIVRYDPESQSFTELDARLPSPRSMGTALWTGREVLLFGGERASGVLDEIVRFDPATGAVRLAQARLPAPLFGAHAVWDGKAAWIVGGDRRGPSALVYRYDVERDEIEDRTELLPRSVSHGASVVSSGNLLLFGGYANEGAVLLFDPTGAPVPEPLLLAEPAAPQPGERVLLFDRSRANAPTGTNWTWSASDGWSAHGGVAERTFDTGRYTVEVRATWPGGKSALRGVTVVVGGAPAPTFPGPPRHEGIPPPPIRADSAPSALVALAVISVLALARRAS